MNRTQDSNYRHDIDERVNKAKRDSTHEGIIMLIILVMVMGGYFAALDYIF